MIITYPVGRTLDDTGVIITGATVTIASVVDKAGNAIASHGAVVNGVDGSNVLVGKSFLSVDYDPKDKGEAYITLAVSKSATTITGERAAPYTFAALDSDRTLRAIPDAAASAAGGLLTRGTGTGQLNVANGRADADVQKILGEDPIVEEGPQDSNVVAVNGEPFDGSAVPSLVTGYVTGQRPRDDLFSNPAVQLAVDAGGRVSLASAAMGQLPVTAPSGRAATVDQMIVQIWRHFFEKTVYDDANNKFDHYNDAGNTILLTQPATVVGSVQTLGRAATP